MALYIYRLRVIVVWCCVSIIGCNSELLTQPQQVHLAYGEEGALVVTWTTINATDNGAVEYGLHGNLSMQVSAQTRVFIDGGSEKRKMFVHSAQLKNLKPLQRYVYHVGSSSGWSDLFEFNTHESGSDWSPVVFVYGDMGNVNARSVASLQQAAQKHAIDSILHIGDFAYDLDSENARVGDAFMNEIQPIAAYVPYMTCPGNHEQMYNFSNYKARFQMPNSHAGGLYYSYDLGPAHIVAVSTELYYYDEYNISDSLPLIKQQYQWLQQDLREANKPENRGVRPWLIVVGHRPMYCSTNEGSNPQHCNNLHNNKVRTGLDHSHSYGLESLFYKEGVDLQFYAHEHSYERLWPVYNLTVCNGTSSAYVDPPAPVHVVTGSAGNREGQTKFDKVLYPWSAFHTDDFGYTKMHIINGSHLHLQQLSINQGGEVVDEITLVRRLHGAGIYHCG